MKKHSVISHPPTVLICPKCHEPILDDNGHPTTKGSGVICNNCYYGKLGEGVEKHPIGRPRIHRGT